MKNWAVNLIYKIVVCFIVPLKSVAHSLLLFSDKPNWIETQI